MVRSDEIMDQGGDPGASGKVVTTVPATAAVEPAGKGAPKSARAAMSGLELSKKKVVSPLSVSAKRANTKRAAKTIKAEVRAFGAEANIVNADGTLAD